MIRSRETSQGQVRLRPVDAGNLPALLALRSGPGATRSAVHWIAHAYIHPAAVPLAIETEDTTVGFTMLEDWSLDPRSAPLDWRAERHVTLRCLVFAPTHNTQRSRVGAIHELLAYTRARPWAASLVVSPGGCCEAMRTLLLQFGFCETPGIEGVASMLQLRMRTTQHGTHPPRSSTGSRLTASRHSHR